MTPTLLSAAAVDVLLFTWRPGIDAEIREWAGPTPLEIWQEIDGTGGRAYVPAGVLDAGRAPAGVGVTRLDLVFDAPGAAEGEDAPFHYVVCTDVEPAAEADLNAWYDQEHMPGLASVPGTAHARRHADRQGSPRYHASYDLARQEAFNSPPWLAVRATDWSSRVRPNFRNTTRIMYRRVP